MDIAGHLFEHGICVRPLTGGERIGQRCGVELLSIQNTQREDINQPGIAHTGNLNSGEYEQIEKYRKEFELRLADAMGSVRSSL